jgi:membrane protein YqaA with SNARE-associated domain
LQFQDIFNWLSSLSIQYGYFGIFVVSLLGAASIFFPVPDSAIIFALGGSALFNPLLITVAATIGGTFGEFSGYLLGFGGRKTIKGRYGKNINFFDQLFKKYGSLAIFIFALTPLPDDLIFIPVGVMRYSVVKAFIPAFIGKFILNLLIVYSGLFFVDFIGDAVGITNDWLPAVISTILGIVVFILMLKIDWQKYLGKYFVESKQKSNDN